MSGSPAWPLQQAVYSRLSGDATLTTTLSADVYDNVPSTAVFPYVAIGNVTEGPRDTMGRTGRDLEVTIHIWSQYAGMKQTKEIQNRVDELLDRWAPTVTGWNATQMQQEFFEVFMDADGVTRHGVSRYGIHIHAS